MIVQLIGMWRPLRAGWLRVLDASKFQAPIITGLTYGTDEED